MLKINRCLMIVLLLVGAFQVAAWANIGVSTLEINVQVAPGKSLSGSFAVINNSEKPAKVRVSLGDYDRNLNGGIRILPAGTLPRSLANFITFSPAEFTLAAGKGKSQKVSFTVVLPEGEAGPHWSLLLVQEVQPKEGQTKAKEGEQTTQGLIGIRFGIQIRQTDPTMASPAARITDVEVTLPEGGQPLKVIVDFENTGSTFLRTKGELRFINAKSEVVATVAILPFRMLPGHQRRLEIPLAQALPAGDYIALAIFDFGGDFLLGGEARFSIP